MSVAFWATHADSGTEGVRPAKVMIGAMTFTVTQMSPGGPNALDILASERRTAPNCAEHESAPCCAAALNCRDHGNLLNPHGPPRGDLQGSARQGQAQPSGCRRHRPRDPSRPARRRRRTRGGQGVHVAGARTRSRRRGLEGPQPRPAGRADRQRGARRDPRRPAAPDRVRQEAADRHHARRPPGRRQDDPRRQAREVAEVRAPHPAARRRRPPAPQRRHPAPGRRRAGRRAGVGAGARQRRR